MGVSHHRYSRHRRRYCTDPEVGGDTHDHELAALAKTPKQRLKIAEKVGTDDKLVLDWVTAADRMRVKGVGWEYSELLRAAGVKTVNELKYRNPQKLVDQMTEANARRKLVRLLPSVSMVQRWIENAKNCRRSSAIDRALGWLRSPRPPQLLHRIASLRRQVTLCGDDNGVPQWRSAWTHSVFSARLDAPADVLRGCSAKRGHLVMGVLNVTPDSFSDGGRFLDPQAAIAQARRLVAEGADIIDVGAELTRPYGGAVRVSAEDERARLEPVSLRRHRARRAGLDRYAESLGRRLGARSRRGHRQRRLGFAGRSRTWRAWSPTTTSPVIIMHNREAPIRRSISSPTSPISSNARWRSPHAPASRASASCSIPASASARRRSKA